MASTDLAATNGHAADTGRPAGDTRRVAGTRTTLVTRTVLDSVDAEMARLGWPGSRIAFLDRIILTGLQASARVDPINLDGQLSATFRPNGPK